MDIIGTSTDCFRGRRDLMVVGFTTTCSMSAYHQWRCDFESRSWQSVLDTTLCEKFARDLRQVVGIVRVLLFPPQKKDRNDMAEILLKVILNTRTLTLTECLMLSNFLLWMYLMKVFQKRVMRTKLDIYVFYYWSADSHTKYMSPMSRAMSW